MTYNFFLTDIMKTGNHQLLEKFIKDVVMKCELKF